MNSLLTVYLYLGIALGLASTQAASTPPTPSDVSAIHAFDYDAKAPLDVRQLAQESVGGILVKDITYPSPKGGRIPAYLVVPSGKGPFAGVVFQHWGLGNRSEFLPEARFLAKAGAESILLDAPPNRPKPWRHADEGQIENPSSDRELFIQTVVDFRRSLDVLLAQPGVDPKRLAFVGHSYGASWGGTLAGVDKRVKAYVLMAGLPVATDFSEDYAKGAAVFEEYFARFRQKYTAEQFQKYKEAISPLEAVHFLPHAAPAALFMQFATKDVYISPLAARQYWEAASQPKEQHWYNCDHSLNDPKALLDRDLWLETQLSLRPVTPLILQQMGLKVTLPSAGKKKE